MLQRRHCPSRWFRPLPCAACRSAERRADRVLAVMAEYGLRPGTDALEVYMTCEIPANGLLPKDFAQRFDGFSIGSKTN